MNTDKLLEFIDRQGIPVAMLIFGLCSLVYLWKWFAREMIIPFRDTLIKRCLVFIDRLEDSLGKVHTRQDASEKAREQHKEILEEMHAHVLEVKDSCLRMEIKLGTAHQFKPRRQTKIQSDSEQTP